MIQRCPNCQKDVIFSRDICPACGVASAEGERTGITSAEQERLSSRYPTYTGPLEDQMTNAQRSGRLLLALATGFLVAPFLAYFLVCLAWLSFRFGALLCIIGLMWLLCRVWEGKRWAVRLAAGLAAIVGIVGAVRGVVQSRALPGPVVGLFCVFGPIFVGVAWFLTFSPPVREYLKMLRLRREKKVQDR